MPKVGIKIPKIVCKMKWADGQYGAVPIFTNYKKAKKFAGKVDIITVFKNKGDSTK